MTRLAKCSAIAAGLIAMASPALAQSANDSARFDAAQRRFANEMQIFRQEFDRYQNARLNYRGDYRDQGYDNRYPGPPPQYNDPARYERDEGGYDPSRYYRDGSGYQERVLTSDDRVYRGNDGRYYCKRNDGTTGLIVGAVGGGILGNVIDGGHSRAVGTLLGGALGAVAGKAIDQGSGNQVRCR